MLELEPIYAPSRLPRELEQKLVRALIDTALTKDPNIFILAAIDDYCTKIINNAKKQGKKHA